VASADWGEEESTELIKFVKFIKQKENNKVDELISPTKGGLRGGHNCK
jgi:hypothetical protein